MVKNEIELGNLYDFNKQAIKQQKPMDAILIHTKTEQIAKTMMNNKHPDADSFYFMICPDNRQYILFKINKLSTKENVAAELREVLFNRGKVIDIDSTHEDEEVWEIWIEDKFTNELLMYQLINYTEDVITC